MKTKQLLLTTLALALLTVIPAVAQADPITLSLPGSVSLPAGGSVTVNGSIANGGAPEFNINFWSINLSDPLLTFNDANLNNLPLVLGAGASYGPASFFDVFADASLAPGNYVGTLTIFESQQRFVTTTFQIQVQRATVPEPVSIVLLSTGLGGMYLTRRRKRKLEGNP